MTELQTILQGIKNNDRRCQEKLYRQYYPAFYALCKSFFTDRQEILTVVNDGMLKIFKKIHQYDPAKGDFFDWAYTTVRNTALTQLRGKIKGAYSEPTDSLSDSSIENPFEQLEWKDIYYYLDQLPENTRIVCALYYIDGFSIGEISTSIDMKEGTVKWHMHECRKRLKVIFESSKKIIKIA